MALAGLARAQQPDADLLIIEFSGVDVGVLEPPGWHGDVDGAQVAFRHPNDAADQTAPIIRVQVEKKVDKSATEDFSSHLKRYHEQFPDIATANLDISHPAYGSSAKLFSVPVKFYAYVVYVNPKKRGPILLSATMNTGSRAATAEELKAFNLVVQSLVML